MRYFQANDCEIIENNPGYITVQLTIDLDKELMNRPFYWHYLRKNRRGAESDEANLYYEPRKAPEKLKGK